VTTFSEASSDRTTAADRAAMPCRSAGSGTPAAAGALVSAAFPISGAAG
jgi:hypothetical protein